MSADQSPRAGDGIVLAALQLAEEIATERLAACRVANEGYPHRCVGEVRDLQTIRAGLAALAAAPAAAPAWQPIETAPRDGADVLLFGGADEILVGGWAELIGWTDSEMHRLFPTHWMPLPAAPEIPCAATGDAA